jgi:hypothetical protein
MRHRIGRRPSRQHPKLILLIIALPLAQRLEAQVTLGVWPLGEVGFFGEAWVRFLDGADRIGRGVTLGIVFRTAS